MTHIPIAIVGGGMTGLATARRLPPASYQIFEKVEGQGGLLPKRIEQQRADIGAQFFTVRDPNSALSNLHTQLGRFNRGNLEEHFNRRYRSIHPIPNACGCALHERAWAVFIPIRQDRKPDSNRYD